MWTRKNNTWLFKKDFDIIWKKFNRLLIVEEASPSWVSESRPNGFRRVICKCDCWNIITTNYSRVKTWRAKSCWCFSKEVRVTRMTWNKIWLWKTHTAEARKKMSITKWWNKDTLKQVIRASFEYKQWRTAVYKRDNYTCQITNVKWNGNLEVHHIINLSTLVKKYNIETIEGAINCKELWDINNWITMDKTVHSIFHKKYNYLNNSMEQILEFKNNQV